MKLAALAFALTSPALADVQVEDFQNGMSNDFFEYTFEFPGCCWGIDIVPDTADQFALHLFPNTVNITFALAGDDSIEAASIDITDFEGGFAGTPTSVAIFRGKTDFVFRNAAELFVLDTLSATMNDLGQLTGEPIGPIVQIDIQAPNENLDIPGAYFDNLTVTIADACVADFNADGALNILDFVAFQGAFVKGDQSADVNADGLLNILDFVAFQGLFQKGCP